MKLDVFDKNGKKVSTVDVAENVFGVTPNENLMAQYIRIFLANQRQGTSSTKTRDERRGGGRKPWRQKGTGRARHGSIRSPIWRKGGVTHGPKPKSWNLNLPKRMKRAAIVSALSDKQVQNQIKILDKLEMKAPKTKTVADVFEKLNVSGKSLVVLNHTDETLRKSARNIKNVTVVSAQNLNAYDLLRAKNVVFLENSIKLVNDKYASK